MSQKLRDYEVVVLFQPDWDEENRNQFIESFSGILTHGEGEEAKPVVNHWGRRDLAYAIKKYTEGYYILIEASLDGTKIREIERDLNYNENILRYLFVRKEEEGKG